MHARAAIGLLLVSSWSAVGCGVATPGGAEPAAPEMRFAQVSFMVYQEGRLTAAGKAASVTYRRDTGDLAAETVAVSFTDAGAGEAPRLFAPRAHGNARARSFFAEGGLRLEHGSDVATTEEARYDPGDRMIHGDRPTVLQGPGWTLEGPGFLLDPATKRLDLVDGVRLDVRDAQARPIR